jgi:hypothetical protein
MVAMALILGSLDQLHPSSIDPDRQRGDDDPPARVPLATHREPPSAKSREATELAPVDRLGRRDERAGAPRLHFNEHVAIPVATDKIDLAEARALVPSDDAESAPDQLDLSRALSRETQGTPIHA